MDPSGAMTSNSNWLIAFPTSNNLSVTFRTNNVGNNAFDNCKGLTSVTIAEGVTFIGNNAFRGCTSLENVTFAAGSQLQTIGNSAFRGCTSLSAITIPSGVTSIGDGVFDGCTSLISVTFAGSAITNTNFGNDTFPEESGGGGNTLRTAYLAGGAGTYKRTASTWTKQ